MPCVGHDACPIFASACTSCLRMAWRRCRISKSPASPTPTDAWAAICSSAGYDILRAPPPAGSSRPRSVLSSWHLRTPGSPLDHVNAHKHFHLHPTILGLLISSAREFGARAIRVPDEPLWFAARAKRWDAAAGTLLTPWLMLMRHRLRAAGIFHNDRLFGIANSGSMDESQLLAILARLPRGVTEIYMHPAIRTGIASSMRTYRHADRARRVAQSASAGSPRRAKRAARRLRRHLAQHRALARLKISPGRILQT